MNDIFTLEEAMDYIDEYLTEKGYYDHLTDELNKDNNEDLRGSINTFYMRRNASRAITAGTAIGAGVAQYRISKLKKEAAKLNPNKPSDKQKLTQINAKIAKLQKGRNIAAGLAAGSTVGRAIDKHHVKKYVNSEIAKRGINKKAALKARNDAKNETIN